MNGQTEVVSSLAGRNQSPLASFEERTRKGGLFRQDRWIWSNGMAKALPASCRLNFLWAPSRFWVRWQNFSSPLVATKFLVISKEEGRSPLISFSACGKARRDPQQRKGESLLAVALFQQTRLSKRKLFKQARSFARSDEGGLGKKADDYMRGKLSTKLCPLLYRDCYELTK